MKDYGTHLEALRKQAAESALISALTTVPQQRELFAKHAEHLSALAAEVEREMVAANEEASASLGLSAHSFSRTEFSHTRMGPFSSTMIWSWSARKPNYQDQEEAAVPTGTEPLVLAL